MNTVDVVIPLYNGKKWIFKALQSVKDQTHPVGRIIVVDDGSSDGAPEEIKKMEGVMVIDNLEEGRASGARICGFKKTTAPFVAFLDQDDVWHPDHLKFLVEPLIESPQASGAISLQNHFQDEKEEPSFIVDDMKVSPVDPWQNFPFGIDCEPSLMLFRREVFDEFTWERTYDGYSDFILLMKLTVNHTVLGNNLASVGRRNHNQSYYSDMVRDLPDFFDKHHKATEELYDYYKNNGGGSDKFKLMDRRREFKKKLYQFVLGLSQNQPSEVVSGVQGMELALKDESEEQQEFLFKVLWHFTELVILSEDFNASPVKGLRNIHSHIPIDCSIVGKYYSDKLINERPGGNFYLKYIADKWWDIKRLGLFFYALKCRAKV